MRPKRYAILGGISLIVIVLSKCTPSLRGDLSKWFFEISPNVFVGKVSSRIRDYLWERIVRSIKDGRATMAYSSHSEQGFDYRVCGTDWKVVDLDGIKVMLRPANKN